MNGSEGTLYRLQSAQKLIEKLMLEGVQVANAKEMSNPTDIASVLEHLKAIPDYLMSVLLQNYSICSTNTNFPLYFETQSIFKRYMKRNYKEIIQNNELYNKLEEIQYYNDKSNRRWMKELHQLANKSKHSELPKVSVNITKKLLLQTKDYRINMIANSIVIGKDGKLISGNEVIKGPINVTLDTIDKNPHSSIKKIDYVERIFEDTYGCVLDSLQRMYDGVNVLIKKFE